MPVKITATIDGLTEQDFDRLRAGGTGSRYEVMLDWTDGDHHELEAHFRLVEEHATRPAYDAVDQMLADRIAAEQERYPLRVAHFGGLGGSGPVFEVPVQNRPGDLLVSRLAELVGALVTLTKISPRVLGIPDGNGPLGERIYLYLTGGEQQMGKHGDGKAADSKNPPSTGGGKHESGGKGK